MPSQKNPTRLADPDSLKDWNRRVRRLANAYAPKYRPLVLSIGYHTNLEEGQTYVKVDTIVGESARWTASGKPLDTRYAKKLLAEMKAVGALTAEERFRDDTGRQTSSFRSLDTSIAVDRHGKPVDHDFWAPFDESAQDTEKKDTPRDTPKDTPGNTPQDTRTVSELSPNYQRTNNDLSLGDGDDWREPFSGKEEKPGQGNIYIVRTWKSGKKAYARLDRADGLASKGAFSDQVVRLSDEEASRMWTAWPAVSPEPPETREARIGYLLSSPGERTALMEERDLVIREEREQETREAEQAQAATERAEREMWDSEEGRAKILAAMPDYVPDRVWYAPRIPEIFDNGQSGKSVWYHPGLGVVTLARGHASRPGPGWQRKTLKSIFYTPDDYRYAQRVQLPAT
jgi:hypothetical protein